MSKILFKGHIVYPDHVSESPELIAVEGGTITFVGRSEEFHCSGDYTVYDFGTAYVCPGFVDLHVHGSGGADVMDGTPEALHTIAEALARGGTTSFLAATMSAPKGSIEDALNNVADATRQISGGARILGAHLEGPFLNREKRGAQKEECLRPLDTNEFEAYLNAAKGTLKMITLAPELPGAIDLIKYAKARGLVVSMGHTAASFDQVREACRAGLSHVTHMFNAMSSMHHRDPGAVGAALGLDELVVDIIPDGYHIHPEIIKIAVQAKGVDNVCAITDCIRAGCMDDGEYGLGGQRVHVRAGTACLQDGTLAGSTLSMSRAVKMLVETVGLSIGEAVKMAATNPARILGFGSKGRLRPAMDADITVVDRNFGVLMTMVGGQVVYSRGE